MSEYTPAEVMAAYGITKPSITDKITALAATMNTMAATDMGHLKGYQAALFHTACDAINELATQLEDSIIEPESGFEPDNTDAYPGQQEWKRS